MNNAIVWSILGISAISVACSKGLEEPAASAASALESSQYEDYEESGGGDVTAPPDDSEDAPPPATEDEEIDCGSGGGGQLSEGSSEEVSSSEPDDVISNRPKPIQPRCKPICGTDEGHFGGCLGKPPKTRLEFCTCVAKSSTNPKTGFTRCECM